MGIKLRAGAVLSHDTIRTPGSPLFFVMTCMVTLLKLRRRAFLKTNTSYDLYKLFLNIMKFR